MDKKLNFTDLCAFYAKAVGLSAGDAESFVHAFYDTIVEGLEKDGIVKINGLGTFKVVEVESRSSVNINTGERFEIDGHNRLTFLPADSLKDIINAPFAMFEPVEVDDDIDDEEDENESKDISNVAAITVENPVSDEAPPTDAQVAIVEEISIEEPSVEEDKTTANEEVAIPVTEIEEEMPQEVEEEQNTSTMIAEIEEEMPIEEADYAPENIHTKSIEEQQKQQEITPLDEVEVPEANKEEIACESENNKEDSDNNTPIEEESVVEEIVTPAKNEEIFFNTLPRTKKRNKYLKLSILFLFIIVCAASAFVGLHFYNKNILSANKIAVVKEVQTPKEDIIEKIVPQETDSTIIANDSAVNVATDTIVQKENVTQTDTIIEVLEKQKETSVTTVPESFKIVDALAIRELSTIFVADTTDYKITGTKCTHKVKSEETLIKISQKYYGDKRLWPYIVKHNNMSRPNDLACDMLLEIPTLTPQK